MTQHRTTFKQKKASLAIGLNKYHLFKYLKVATYNKLLILQNIFLINNY